jgi:hypothetical protein
MPVPGSSDIQFVPPGQAKFSVDKITDPGGAPAHVLDVDLGFVVSGIVSLPNWLSGKGQVCIYADELGGHIDMRLQPCYQFDITPTTGEPKLKAYPWSITFPPSPPVLPDPSKGSQLYRLAAVFLFGDQSTDIAAFVEMGTYLIN